MENKKFHKNGENATLISTKFNQSSFLVDARRVTVATLVASAVCFLSLIGVMAQEIRNNFTPTKLPSAGTDRPDNRQCVFTFAPSGGSTPQSDPNSALAGYLPFGGYDRGGYEYSQEQRIIGDSRRIVSVDAGCTLGTQQLETEVNKLVSQGFEVYAMGTVQPGQVVVMLRQPTLKASMQN